MTLGIGGLSRDDRDRLALSGKIFSQFGQQLGRRRYVRVKITIDEQNRISSLSSNDGLCHIKDYVRSSRVDEKINEIGGIFNQSGRVSTLGLSDS